MKKIIAAALSICLLLECITGSSYVRKERRLARSRAKNKDQISIFGELITGDRIDSANILFQHMIPTDLTTSRFANGGYVTQANSMLNLSSGTNAYGEASIRSKGALHYIAGHEAYAYFTALFTSSTPNSTQWAGLFNSTNGLALGFNGTKFSIILRNNEIDNIVSQEDFSLDILNGSGISGIKLDTTKLNIFKISYGWLGAAPITFEICREDGVWFPFHKINYPNLSYTPNIGNTSLPMNMEIKKNNADATNLTIKSGSWNFGTIGGSANSTQREYQQSVKGKPVSAGASVPILSIRSKTIFYGEENSENAVLIFSSVASRPISEGWCRFSYIKNADLTGAIWIEKDSNNSFIEYDISSTSATSGDEVFFIPVTGRTQEKEFFLNRGVNIKIYPGETLTVLATPETNTIIDSSIIWREIVS